MSSFRIDEGGRRINFGEASLVASPFDENALEMALQIRDNAGGRLAVISMGAPTAEKVLRSALALRVEEAVLVSQGGSDPFNSCQTAHVLGKAINSLSFEPDLILCGCQAADTDAGHVGALVAEQLGWTCVSLVREIRVNDGKLIVEREEEDYHYVLEVDLPAVVTVASTPANQIRYPKLKDVIMAQKRPLTRVYDPAVIGVSPADIDRWGKKLTISRFDLTNVTRECFLVKPAEVEEMVEEAAEWLSMKGLV